MEKEFVTKEIANKVKVLGFNEDCFGTYYKEVLHLHGVNNKFLKEESECSAPLWQQVVNWLREEHGFEFNIGYYFNNIKGKQYDMEMYRDTHFVNPDVFDTVWRDFNSHYEAQEYSILKALQILENESNKKEKENRYNGR